MRPAAALLTAAAVALVVGAAACASSGPAATAAGPAPVASLATGGYGAASARTDCSPTTVDSMFAAVAPVYRNCEVDRPAMAMDSSVYLRDLPPQGQSCLSAVIEFVVGANGLTLPKPVHVVQTNSPAFARSLLQNVARWRYRAAIKDGKPVRQIIRMEAATRATSPLDPPYNPRSFANIGPTTC